MPKLQGDQAAHLGQDLLVNLDLDQLDDPPAIVEVGTDPVFVREQVIPDLES